VSPHGHLGWYVEEPEVAGLCFPCLVGVAVHKHKLEEGVVVSRMVVLGPGGEFLVSWHQRGGNIVGKKVTLCIDMEKLEYILVAHDTAASCFRQSLGGNDFPVVICIIVAISSNLLSLRRNQQTNRKNLKKKFLPWLLIRPSAYVKG
jgi:hypothetical protein